VFLGLWITSLRSLTAATGRLRVTWCLVRLVASVPETCSWKDNRVEMCQFWSVGPWVGDCVLWLCTCVTDESLWRCDVDNTIYDVVVTQTLSTFLLLSRFRSSSLATRSGTPVGVLKSWKIRLCTMSMYVCRGTFQNWAGQRFVMWLNGDWTCVQVSIIYTKALVLFAFAVVSLFVSPVKHERVMTETWQCCNWLVTCPHAPLSCHAWLHIC